MAVRRLDGKKAVIVGGGVGWGAASALRLSSEGADVAVVDQDEAAADQVASSIRARGDSASSFGADVLDLNALGSVAQQFSGGGAIDVLVTHYFLVDWATFEETSIEDFRRVIDYDLVGPVIASKALLPFLRKSSHGSIIHIGSIDGIYGNPRVASYSTAKSGYTAMTHVMAREFARDGITVNTVASGATEDFTDEQLAADPSLYASVPSLDYLKQLIAANPLKRSMGPEAWAGTIAHLASDDASYVTGAIHIVDCGRTGITPGTE